MTFSPEEVIRTLILNNFPADLVDGTHAGRDTPAAWDAAAASRLPFVQIRSLGGARQLIIHRPRIVITTWAVFSKSDAAGRAAAEDLAGRIDEFLTYKTPTTVNGVVIGISGSTQSPAYSPYNNENVTRYEAIYRFSMHETHPA